ncbi:MAG: hypothetical protein JST89_22315 [Cyanobacteria bacterium SZAS-4]|nr:hypothetical protein [Cyanobacteria bacterium SZAS-4]
MSEELLQLPTTTKRNVRYPLFLNHAEMPHRLYPLVDICVQILNVLFFFVCIELLAILTVPAGSELSMIMVALIPFFAIFMRFFLRNARLTIVENGISFPLLMARELNGRLSRPWTDLETVDLHDGKDKHNFVQGNVLTMQFKSGGRVDLDTTRIPRDDLRLLQESLLKWSQPDVLTPAVSELVSRNDLEISDSTAFVFAKKRRQVLSNFFGLTNGNLWKKGDSVLGGNYIIEKVLAAAGARSSYLANDTRAGRNVCLTEYDLTMLDVDAREQVSAKLLTVSEPYKHLLIPGLLNLHDTAVSGDKFYTMMEPASKTLRAHVTRYGALSEKKVYALGLRLAEIVGKLNERTSELYVGSIRPDSITYTSDGAVSIAEFGFVDDLIMTSSQVLVVDAAYAAPERISGLSTRVSDLYSIGATMYFALTKVDPEPCASSQASAVNAKVSPALSNLIAKLLSRDPSQRGSVSELIHALGGVSELTHDRGPHGVLDTKIVADDPDGAEHV